MPDTDTLKALTEWGNLNQIILKAGRTVLVAPDANPNDPDFDPEAALAAAQEADPTVDRFRDLEQHDPISEGQPAWISKVVGDTQLYNQAPPKEGTVSYAVNVIQSLRWPGAVTVAKGGKFTTIYVGYGLKHGAASYNPVEPPSVVADPDDPKEKPEPNPKNAPVEAKEADSDKQDDDDE